MILCLSLLQPSTGTTLRRLDISSGMSSQLALALCQDARGFVWVATYSGLNMVTGSRVMPLLTGQGTFQTSGSIINDVQRGRGNTLWVHTNMGINRIDLESGHVDRLPHMQDERMAASDDGEFIVHTADGRFHYYNEQDHRLHALDGLRVGYGHVAGMFVTPYHQLLVCSGGKLVVAYLHTDAETGEVTIKGVRWLAFPYDPLRFMDFDGRWLFVVDGSGNLRCADLSGKPTLPRFGAPIYNIQQLTSQRSDISAIARLSNGDVCVGFRVGGAVILHKEGGHYVEQTLPINCGVTDLQVDRHQRILWLSTDGEGVRQYTSEPYTFHNELFSTLPFNISKPVRAIYRDREGTLWVGTKGDGIIAYPDYHPFGTKGTPRHLTDANSQLANNSVYVFAPSQRPLLWIGTDGTCLNYYSYATRQIQRLYLPIEPFDQVHDLYEVSPTELWVATGGRGVLRVTLGGPAASPVVVSVKRLFYDASSGYNQYSSIARQGRYLWLGRRDCGLVRYDLKRHTYRFVYSHPGQGLHAEDDILSVSAMSDGRLYCATSVGLMEVTPRGGRYVWQRLTMGSRMSGMVLRSVAGQPPAGLWACTPSAVLHYDIRHGSMTMFTSENGIGVTEFSDGACYYDAATGVKYFGGNNGFTALSRPEGSTAAPYHPDLVFTGLQLNQSIYGITHFMHGDVLRLSHDENNLTLYYSVPDNIDANSYIFQYRYGDHDPWLDNGNARQLLLSNVQPGSYTLQMRYIKGTYTSPVYRLRLRVSQPWYWSWWMKLIYLLVIATVVGYAARESLRRQRMKQRLLIARLHQQQKETVYTSNLRFFTNITQEFATPISLIIGSCQRLLSQSSLPEQVRSYGLLIQRNCARLNALIRTVADFRGIEGNHRKPVVVMTDLHALVTRLAHEFGTVADRRHITLDVQVADDVQWPTDRDAFITIVTNLLSCALKLCDDEGRVALTLRPDGKWLLMLLQFTGRPLTHDEIAEAFDHYRAVERLEHPDGKGGAAGGLELSISLGLAGMLKGDLTLKPGEKGNTFVLSLPRLSVSQPSTEAEEMKADSSVALDYVKEHVQLDEPAVALQAQHEGAQGGKPTVVVVDDNEEVLWFLNDCLEDDYQVIALNDARQVEPALAARHADVLIAEVSMPHISGIDLCRQFKQNVVTTQLPVILLSSRDDEQTRLDSVDAGADYYITRPFDIGYLRSVVGKCISRKQEVKNYYESGLGSFELVGDKLLHKEDKELLDKMMDIVNRNISNPDLTAQFVADQLGMGTRSLYRRLETITAVKPAILIREARLEKARSLLANTKMTMQEVCFQAGFNNRGTFYKLFAEKYGCTPKQYHDRMMQDAQERIDPQAS